MVLIDDTPYFIAKDKMQSMAESSLCFIYHKCKRCDKYKIYILQITLTSMLYQLRHEIYDNLICAV